MEAKWVVFLVDGPSYTVNRYRSALLQWRYNSTVWSVGMDSANWSGEKIRQICLVLRNTKIVVFALGYIARLIVESAYRFPFTKEVFQAVPENTYDIQVYSDDLDHPRVALPPYNEKSFKVLQMLLHQLYVDEPVPEPIEEPPITPENDTTTSYDLIGARVTADAKIELAFKINSGFMRKLVDMQNAILYIYPVHQRALQGGKILNQRIEQVTILEYGCDEPVEALRIECAWADVPFLRSFLLKNRIPFYAPYYDAVQQYLTEIKHGMCCVDYHVVAALGKTAKGEIVLVQDNATTVFESVVDFWTYWGTCPPHIVVTDKPASMGVVAEIEYALQQARPRNRPYRLIDWPITNWNLWDATQRKRSSGFHPDDPDALFNEEPRTKPEVVEHCRKLLSLAMESDDSCSSIPDMLSLCNLLRFVSLCDVDSISSSLLVSNLWINLMGAPLLPAQFHAPIDGFEGGVIEAAVKHELVGDVRAFDFKSAYPRIIHDNNISPDILDAQGMTRQRTSKKGAFAVFIGKIIEERRLALENNHAIRQRALKLLANKSFGVLSLWFPQCGAMVTANCRLKITKIIDYVRSRPHLRFVLAQTDGLFFQNNAKGTDRIAEDRAFVSFIENTLHMPKDAYSFDGTDPWTKYEMVVFNKTTLVTRKNGKITYTGLQSFTQPFLLEKIERHIIQQCYFDSPDGTRFDVGSFIDQVNTAAPQDLISYHEVNDSSVSFRPHYIRSHLCYPESALPGMVATIRGPVDWLLPQELFPGNLPVHKYITGELAALVEKLVPQIYERDRGRFVVEETTRKRKRAEETL